MSRLKKFTVMFGVAAAMLTVFGFGIALGQQDNQAQSLFTRIKPLLVQIQQSVPISLTIEVPTSETETLTVTIPAVVDLNMKVSIADTVSGTVQVLESANSALVTVSELLETNGNLVDNNDIPYIVENAENVELIQWITEENSLGWTEITGELRNTSEERSINSVKLTITLYDADGKLLDVIDGYGSLDTIGPGQTSPFELYSSEVPISQLGQYLVQVEVRFEN